LSNIVPLVAFILVITLSATLETRFDAQAANSIILMDRWVVIQDLNGDRLRVETSNDSVWTILVQLYHNGSTRWVGGIVEMYKNEWGFRFNPSTIFVAEVTIEAIQTTIRGISQNLPYWLGHLACVDAKVVAINPVRVPQDFVTIQEAINNAVSQGTVLVAAGIYQEHVVVNKTVSLIALNRTATIIQSLKSYPVALVNANNVTINGFALENGWRGILIQSSYDNISVNTMRNNVCGIELSSSSGDSIYHNNFLNGGTQALVSSDSLNNVWDAGYPSGGNYWMNYTGVDDDGDGIGDSPYVINLSNQDNYPLMTPYPYFSGDINCDGIINKADLILLDQSYGTTPTSLKWSPNADVNNDKIVNVRDLQILSKNYGKTLKE
jgi:parallel beta-helix repeat protein